MAKGKKVEEEILPVKVEDTTEVLQVLSEDEQIVEGNKELAQIRKDIAESRAEFVRQTDKQQEKIKELDALTTAKYNKVVDYNTIVEIELPKKQAELAEANNKAIVIVSQAETFLAEVVKREKVLEKATAELAKQKADLDVQGSEQELRAVALDKREKELNEREKAAD